jgi:hypothetical protein
LGNYSSGTNDFAVQLNRLPEMNYDHVGDFCCSDGYWSLVIGTAVIGTVW